MATLGSLTLKIRSTRNLLALDLLQCKQEVERFRETANDLLQLKTGVSIDWDSFSRAESEIRRWVDSLPTTNLRVGAKFVGADLQDNIEQLERLLTNPLKIQVDDKRLFELNEHFKLKERDYKQLQSVLDSPLSIKVDRSQLDNLSRDLQAIENTPQVNLRANIDLDALRTFHEQLKRYSQGRTLELATSVSRTTLNSLQNDLKALASSLTTARVSVQIDSQLQALRSELGNLPNVTVGVSIDDSALGEFDKKLGSRKLGLGVDPTDISNIDGHINKLGKKLDSLKPASGLFKAVTFAPAQIATGFFQGLGKDLSSGLGKGYSQGIESALGDTIGSTKLLGSKLAEGIANRSKLAISELVPAAITDALRESINQALGETEVFVESRSRQAIQSKGQRQKKEQAREGVAEERKSTVRQYLDRDKEVTAYQAEYDRLDKIYKANYRVKRIIDDKIETRDPNSRSRAKLELISENLGFDIDVVTKEQINVGKKLRQSKNSLERETAQKERAENIYQSLKPESLPKVYRDAFAGVREDLIPKLVIDKNLTSRGEYANYSAKLNQMAVNPEMYRSMQSGQMSAKEFEILYHEGQHARDFQFGQFQGLVDRDNLEIRKPLKATAKEIKDVAPFVSQYSPELREVEQQAEIAGRRGRDKAYEQQQRKVLSAQLNNTYGLSGTKLDRIINEEVNSTAARAVAIDLKGDKIGIQSPSTGKIFDRAIALKSQQKEIGLEIARASTGDMSSADIEKLHAKIEKQITDVEELSKRVDALKKSVVKRIGNIQKSVSRPTEPVGYEIPDPWATAKPEGIVIDRDKVIEVAATAGQALRQTLDRGKSIVSGVKNTATTAVAGAKSGFNLMQQGESLIMNASPQARLLKSQIQTNIGDRIENARYQIASRVGSAGQFAGFLYQGLKAAESVPLTLMPGGYTAKKVIQNVAAPAAVYTAAHAIPGLGSMLDVASGGIHALAGGAGQLLSSGATGGLSNFVAQALGTVPFHETIVPAVQQGLGTAINAAITGGAETAATVAAPVLIGKSIVNTAGNSLGTGLQKIAQSNPLLQSAQKPLALQPKAAEPVYDYVEVVAEPVTIATSVSQGSSKPTPLNLTPKPKQESKQADVIPPPKLITQITESEAIDKAQKFATQFKKAQKAIEKALADGETQLAFEMGKKIEDYAKIARSEINNIAQLLGDRATTDTPLRDKLNSAKSQITRATNTGARAVTVYQNSNPVAGDELASLKIPKHGEIRDAAAAKLTELRNLFNNSQSPQEPVSPTPLGRPLPPPSNPPVPPKNLPKRNLGSALPPPAQIIPELAARSLNPADLITSIEQKLNYFEGVYPQAERQVRGSEKRGRKNVNKFMGFVDLHQDLFDSSFNRLDRESAKNLQEQQAKTQNLNDRVFTENGITPLGKDVDSLLPKLSDLKNMGAKVISIFAGFAGVAFVGKMLADWGAGAFQAAAKMESLRTTIGAVSASNIKAQSTIARSTTESNKLGYNAVAGLENDAGFFASTRTTALELVAPDIMSGLKSYNRVMGVDENRAKLAQTAVVQMAGKGKITAEELFGQLAESSPGAVNVLSRSMGLSVGQLRKEMESGSLNANDALPRFGNQLSAESLGSIDKSSQSAAASVGRLQNSLAALQVAAGEKIMAPTTLGIVKVTEATDLLKNNIDTLGNIFTAAILSAAASAIGLSAGLGLANPALGLLVKGITLALPLLKTFALQTAVAYAAIELFNTVMNSVNDSSPFKSLADDSEAAFAKISKGASTTKQSIEDLKNEIYGKDRNVFQQIGDGISGTFGGQTSITKKAADDTVNADRLLEQNEKALRRKPVELTEANRIRRSEIDLELSVIRSQNANLTSKDRDKIDINNKKEQKLIEERSNLEKPINTRQAELEQVIKNTNNIIDSPLRNESEKGLAKLQLAEAEKEQRKLQEQLISSASTLSVGLRKVGEGLQAGLAAIDLASINRKTQTYLAAAQDVRNTGALAQANFVDTTTTLSAKQSLQQQAVGNLKSTIYSPENRNTVQALGIDPESIGQEQIDRLKSTVTDTRGQALLGYLSKYQSVKTELAQTNQSLFEAQYNYLKSIADYNKGSIDQVISLQNRLANLSITARNAISNLQQQVEQTLIEIDTTSSKAAFQSQRNKIQTAYNKFLEKLGISTDDIFEQIFTNYNSILDTVQQLVERRLGRTQSENTAKFRVFNNETRKYQVEQEQRTGIEDLKRQESERRLGNPLNQPQSSSGENQPVNSNPSKDNTNLQLYRSQRSGLIVPVVGATNSRGGGYKEDTGLDIMTPIGSNVVASAAGTLEYAEDGHSRQIGEDVDPTTPGFQKQKSIRIKLDTPVEYQGKTYQYQYFTHLRSIEDGLYNKGTHSRTKNSRQAIRIEAGQLLGQTGTAGGGPHLHTGFSADREQRNYLNYQQVSDVLFGTTNTGRNAVGKVIPVQNNTPIAKSEPQLLRSAPTPAVSPTTVTSSTYTPGGGGMNGAEKDSRGNRLTRNDYAIAIPGQNRVKDQIPYGSIVKLNYAGKTVNAKVTDGGPYVPGRQLDMTTAAAKALGFNGVGQVGVSLVSLPKGADPDKKYYFGEATYRPKFGKGGSLSVAEANKAIASVVRGDKYVTLGKSVQAEATNDSQPSNSPPAGKGTLGEAILNNITQQGVEKKIAENEKLSTSYVNSIKTFSDRDSDAGRKKAQQERNLYNQQDESDRTKLDTQILKNQNLLDRNLPTFNRKSVELERQAAAYNRSSNNRDAYQKIDATYRQYGGIPETATQDTAIVNSQSTIDRLKEESRVRRENLLKQIQSIEAQGAGWAELKKRIQQQITSLKKNGFTDDATALEDFIVSNDRAIGTPKARQQTIDRLSKQYRALPSDGIAVYDSIAPGANKVLTYNKALNSQYLPKTFDDNLNAEARLIVERFKAAKEALQGEFLKLDEAIGILEAEIQAKLKAAGYAPQKLDLTDPKRLELLNKVAPEQTVVLQQATARRLQLNLSGQNLDRNADTAAARAVSIGQKRERLTVDRANTDYLAATQDGSIFAQIQIDKQRFTQGKTDLDLQFEQGAVSADLYAAKLKQLTLETDTLRNSVLPLRAATKGFFDDAFSGQGVLDGLGNAVKNLALNILKNFQDIISKELGSQLFGSLAAGAGDLQGEAAGGGILGTLFKGLGFNVAGSKPNTNAGLDLGLNSPILPPPSSGGNSGQSFTGFGLNLGLGLLGLPSIPGFATGGMVTSPTLALVGEGINNEAIVPLPNGRSIPVDLRGAGESSGSSVNSSVSVTIQNSGQARETSRGEGQAISQMIKGAVMDVLVNERRAGGLLS